MLATVSNGGIERHDDLHIDVVDSAWKAKQVWLPGGLEAYATAVQLRQKHELDVSIVLAFSLEDSPEPRGVTFYSLSQLEAEFNWTPPSLYMSYRGSEPWTNGIVLEGQVIADYLAIRELDRRMLLDIGLQVSDFYYMEHRKRGDNDYARSVFVGT